LSLVLDFPSKIETYSLPPKTSPGFTDLERSIDDLDQNIEEVCKETHSILASMETEKSACYSKIKDFRLSADKRLDELEQKLLDELEQIYIKQKSKVQGVTDTCLSKSSIFWSRSSMLLSKSVKPGDVLTSRTTSVIEHTDVQSL
jgi:ElaB/YqjD/DUF883 family membrane-anchored ribosome-binding protein